MYTVWHIDKSKITFKLVIGHWTNEILVTDIAAQMLFRRSGSELFDTFKNIILLRIFPLQNIYSWKMLRKQNDKFQENLSRPGIIDARARYRAAAQRLRNTALNCITRRLYKKIRVLTCIKWLLTLSLASEIWYPERCFSKDCSVPS
jgi:hypothetical protein